MVKHSMKDVWRQLVYRQLVPTRLRKRMTYLEVTPLNESEVTLDYRMHNRSSQSQDAATQVTFQPWCMSCIRPSATSVSLLSYEDWRVSLEDGFEC
jgi:hypothetical protein